MLHEGLGSIALWKDFPAQLAARTGCGVLVYSRYGHGNSDKLMEKRPVRFMHHEGEVVLPELLVKLGVAKPILIGHSDGGSISLIFAGKYPDAVSGLILEAPHVFVEDLSIASIAQAKVTYETTDFPQRLGRYHANVDATFWGWNDIWLDPAFRSWNIEEYLPGITCPVLCIQGEEDEYGTIAQVEAIKAGAPQTEIADAAELQALAASRPGGEDAGGWWRSSWGSGEREGRTQRDRLRYSGPSTAVDRCAISLRSG